LEQPLALAVGAAQERTETMQAYAHVTRNGRPFPEKGLVDDLRATAQKIVELSSRVMGANELAVANVELLDRLMARATETLGALHEMRDEPPTRFPPAACEVREGRGNMGVRTSS
jgi:hypothetical protein